MADGVQTVSLKKPAAEKQSQLYYKDGSPIAPSDVAEAVSRGDAYSSTDEARVTVDGSSARVPTSGLANFLAQRGATVETDSQAKERTLQKEAGSLTGMAKTAGEGLLRGATMGFAGAEQFYDEEGRAAALARMRANPKIAGGTELAGALGSTVAASLLTGGAGAAAGAGSVSARLAALAGRGALTPFRVAAALGEAAEAATGASTLGRVAGLGLRGVAEGALFGAGQQVSEAALEDVPLTAERLLAGAWDGAKMGGAFGLGLGVLGQGVGKAGKAIVGRMAESGDDLGKATGSWAERTMARQHLDGAKIWNKATNYGADMQRPARIGRKLLDADMPSEASAALRRAEELADDAVSRLKQVAQSADEIGARANVEGLLGRVDDQIAKLRETPFGDFQAIADRVEKQIAPFRARVTGELAQLNEEGLINSRYLRTGMRDMSGIRKAYAGASPAEAKAIALGERAPMGSVSGKPLEPIRVDLYPGEKAVLNDGRHRLFAAREAGADSIMARVVKYDADGNTLSESLQPISIDGGGGLKFSELWALRKKLDDTINWEAKQQGPAKEALTEMRDAFRAELDDTIARAADGSSPELLKAWKQATEDYSDFALVKQSLKELSNRRSKNRSISPSDYGTGTAAGMLMGILSGNPITGLATSAVTSAAHKLIRERGAGVIAKIADRQGNVASKLDLAGKVAAMVETPKRLTAPTAVNVSELFDRYSQSLTQAQAEPVQFAKRMGDATADLSLRAPELAQQVQRVMMEDMAYLNQLHPTPTSKKGATMTPMAKLPEFYAFNQKKAFVDAATALDNPLGVFEDIARGELPLTQIETLKARRPLLFNEMRTTVIKYTSTREEELPFSRRMLLGSAFDFPADWSMAHVGDIQAALIAGNASAKPNDPTAAPSKIGTDPGAQVSPGKF